MKVSFTENNINLTMLKCNFNREVSLNTLFVYGMIWRMTIILRTLIEASLYNKDNKCILYNSIIDLFSCVRSNLMNISWKKFNRLYCVLYVAFDALWCYFYIFLLFPFQNELHKSKVSNISINKIPFLSVISRVSSLLTLPSYIWYSFILDYKIRFFALVWEWNKTNNSHLYADVLFCM